MAINTLFQNIADAIRSKNGASVLYTPAEMVTAILNIPSGSRFDIPENVQTLINNLFTTDGDVTIPDVPTGAIYEYKGYITDSIINTYDLDLLLTYNGNSGTGLQTINGSFSDYVGIIAQGAYYNTIDSRYNTSLIYPLAWFDSESGGYYGGSMYAGMKDRNNTYDVYFKYVDNNTINIVSRGGTNAGMFLYGVK